MIRDKLIPKLRFPEFTDEWQVKKLGDYIDSLDAGVSVNSDDSPTDGLTPGVLKTSCVTAGIFDPKENKRVIEPSEVKRLKEPVTANTIIISRMNTPGLVGANAFVESGDKNLYLPDRLWATKISESASAKFIAYKLGSKEYRQKLSSLATGTSNSMKNISKDGVRGLEIIAPRKPEQQKIANFLTTVDQKIKSIDKRVELLKLYKKGVMQRIFSQQIRFKNESDNDFPDWEEKKLGEVVNFINGYTFLSSTYSANGKYKVITIANVQQGKLAVSEANRVDELPENIQRNQILEKGDLLISMTGNVGRTCIVDENDCLLNQRVGKLVAQKIDPLYLYHVISTPRFIAKMISGGQGGAQDNLSSKDIKNYVLAIPEIDEQHKIADFLSAIDDKIKAEETKLASAKKFKKALLQRMFV